MIQVCDIVEYRGERFRVKYHKKRMTDTLPERLPVDELDKVFYDILSQEYLTERYHRLEKGLPANRRYRYVICRPEEATHLQLYSLTNPVAPIEECKFVEVVPWSEELINQTKLEAISDFRLNYCNQFVEWHWE